MINFLVYSAPNRLWAHVRHEIRLYFGCTKRKLTYIRDSDFKSKMAEATKFAIIEKLNNVHYANWKFEMEMLLRRDDLWRFVEYEASEEIQWSSAWKTGNSKALATIVLSLQ